MHLCSPGGKVGRSSNASYPISVSCFHVPQGRSKIAQRFIAGSWCEHETSPARDERTYASGSILLSPRRGAGHFYAQPTVETVGYFRSSLSGLRNQDQPSRNGKKRLAYVMPKTHVADAKVR